MAMVTEPLPAWRRGEPRRRGLVAGAVQKVKQASGLINGGQDSRGAAGVQPVGAVGAGGDRCHEASQYETVVARVAACRLQYSGVGQYLSVFSCINEL